MIYMGVHATTDLAGRGAGYENKCVTYAVSKGRNDYEVTL